MKTVLITGASRGIGAEAARLFADNNYNVIINYNSSKDKALALEAELRSCKKQAYALHADVSSTADVDKMFAETEKLFGGVDVLINNAGICMSKMLCDVSPEEWDKVFAVNTKGIYNCCRAAMPYMINKKCGKIINVSSIWGVSGASCEVAYSASKAAVIGFTKALAKELGPSNIQVNCISPGVIDTEMNSNLTKADLDMLADSTPLGRIGTPDEIARLMLFLSSDSASFITGQNICADGGFII